MVEVFGEAGRHARSAVGMAELPFGHPGRDRDDPRGRVAAPSTPGRGASAPRSVQRSSAPSSRSAAPMRGPYQVRSLPSTKWILPSRTAGMSGYGAKSLDVDAAEPIRLVGQQDDVGRRRRHLLQRHRRIARGAAARTRCRPRIRQHVDGVGVAAERHAGPPPDRAEHPRGPAAGRRAPRPRCRASSAAASAAPRSAAPVSSPHLAHQSDALAHRPGIGHVHRDAPAPQRLDVLAQVLLDVGDHEVGAERANRVERGVLLAADARLGGDALGRLGAVDRAAGHGVARRRARTGSR